MEIIKHYKSRLYFSESQMLNLYRHITVCRTYCFYLCSYIEMYSTCSSVGKESACSAGDPGLTLGLGRSPGEGNSNSLQYPCLENLMERGAWWAAVHGVAKSRAQLSD